MTPRAAVVFPGQGTQTPGMGAAWRDRPEWAAVVGRAEAALGEPLGRLLVEADAEELLRTRNAQLAVLLTSLMAWEAVCDRVAPVAFAGHSLGQVTALIASGVLAFDDGVRFAAVRADRTQAAADARPGAMAALLGATLEQAEAATSAGVECWIANDNAPGQVVLAGTPEGLDAGVAGAKAPGARTAKRLAVGGAFHTPLMQPAADALADDLGRVDLSAPSAPVVSNDDGEPYSDAEGWRTRSAAHVAVPVRWRAVQASLVTLGADRLLEVGHGTMLAALAKRAIPGTPVHAVADPVAADHVLDVA
jgi:[acyl-carrier-protein] S-malonyltransferase